MFRTKCVDVHIFKKILIPSFVENINPFERVYLQEVLMTFASFDHYVFFTA